MRRGQLSDQFEGGVAKRLTEVETRPERSNQHELNGSIRQMLVSLGSRSISRTSRLARLSVVQFSPNLSLHGAR
ncbi:hypothetical protein D3W54_01820 [Komagataeibacter medellinensis]|uniref:Transposase n=1 Tax=Komagataeibacter medellinensis TaxID=1177712 RepID=A0ABQ6VSJ0_9PROT|nr:hypothetical protein D3W54_01820 [Komagataeibacter medellinensis]